MLSSQRKITEVQAHEIDLAEDVGLKQKATFNLMARQAGGRDGLGYAMLDAKNYLRSKRQRSMIYGEVGCLMGYFQKQISKNPSFYHAYQMDMEEQTTNVFWADARMLIDYEYFGDVVSLDTTHCTNRANRPLAIFSGFSHHRRAVIFGAALLYDETTASFKWLFETFLEAHNKKRPITVFTDQDQAMAKALREVMPDTFHGLCTWHLMQNGIKHLGNLMKEGSCFLTDFKRCMYSFDDVTLFEEAWSTLLVEYKLHNNKWLKHMYDVKEKWARCYMNAYTLGMRSAQLSESVNSNRKSCMTPHLNIVQIFKNFEQVVEEKRYSELKCEFEARQKLPRLRLESSPMLKQLSRIYNPSVFDLFQKEYVWFAAAYIKHRNETGSLFEYIIGIIDRDREWRVQYDPNTKMVSCSCRRALYFEKVDKRRTGVVHDYTGNEVEENPAFESTKRYRKLCLILIRLATEASDYQSTFSLVHKTVHELNKKVTEMRLREEGQENDIDTKISPTVPSMVSPKGFKKKVAVKGSKRRLKSWVELQPKRKKANQRAKDLGTQDASHVSSSAPPAPQAPLDQSVYYFDGLYFNGDASNANNQDQDH